MNNTFSEDIQRYSDKVFMDFKTSLIEDISKEMSSNDAEDYYAYIIQILVLESLGLREVFPKIILEKQSTILNIYGWAVEEIFRPLFNKTGQYGIVTGIPEKSIIDYMLVYALNSQIATVSKNKNENLINLLNMKKGLFEKSPERNEKTDYLYLSECLLNVKYFEPDYEIIEVIVKKGVDIINLLSDNFKNKLHKYGVSEGSRSCYYESENHGFYLGGSFDEFSCYTLDKVITDNQMDIFPFTKHLETLIKVNLVNKNQQ